MTLEIVRLDLGFSDSSRYDRTGRLCDRRTVHYFRASSGR